MMRIDLTCPVEAWKVTLPSEEHPECDVRLFNLSSMQVVFRGKVDQILLTGGIAYGQKAVESISKWVDWIAPITVYPGEDELLALVQGALRVLRGEETAQEY